MNFSEFDPKMLLTVFNEMYYSMLLWGFLLMIVLDVMTGLLKAGVTGNIDSRIGLKGLMKHTTIVLLILIMGIVTRLINVQWVSQSFCLYYILQYIFSILENLDEMGIPFPLWLRNSFKRMGSDLNEKGAINNEQD